MLIAFGANLNLTNLHNERPKDLAPPNSELSQLLYQLPDMKSFKTCNGDRLLFLDGGGSRAVLQVEILMEIERCTGERIVELFDWIIGTNIGGIIALELVYGKTRYSFINLYLSARKSLSEIKQLCFQINDCMLKDSTMFHFSQLLYNKLRNICLDSIQAPK